MTEGDVEMVERMMGMTEGDVEMKKKSNGDNIKERGNDRRGAE